MNPSTQTEEKVTPEEGQSSSYLTPVASESNTPTVSSTNTTLIKPANSEVIATNPMIPVGSISPEPQTYSTKRPAKTRTKLHWLPMAIVALVIIIFGLFYSLILPNQWDNSYLSKITPAYNQQSAKMLAVYEAFAMPVFTSSNTTYSSDMKNYAASNIAVTAAQTSTNILKKDNALQTTPGPLLLSQTKLTKEKYQAMKQYVSNSQAFLSNFSNLVSYLKNLEQIEKTQIPTIFSDLNSFNNANSMQTVLQSSENTSTAISALITTLQDLQPPQDLVKFNNTLLADLNTLSSAFNQIIGGINSASNTQILAGATALEKAGVQMQTDSSFDWTGMLQKHSIIHQEIVTLESENPLDIHSPTTLNPSFIQKSQATAIKNAFPAISKINVNQKVLNQIN